MTPVGLVCAAYRGCPLGEELVLVVRSFEEDVVSDKRRTRRIVQDKDVTEVRHSEEGESGNGQEMCNHSHTYDGITFCSKVQKITPLNPLTALLS